VIEVDRRSEDLPRIFSDSGVNGEAKIFFCATFPAFEITPNDSDSYTPSLADDGLVKNI